MKTRNPTVINPSTVDQGARRDWSDSTGRLWITEWNAGTLGMYDPVTKTGNAWKLPGENPQPYAILAESATDRIVIIQRNENALTCSFTYIRDQGQNNELFLRSIVGKKFDTHSRKLVPIP